MHVGPRATGQIVATLTLLFLTGLTVAGLGDELRPLDPRSRVRLRRGAPARARALARRPGTRRLARRTGSSSSSGACASRCRCATIARVETSLFLPEPTAILRLASGRAFERRLSLAPELAALGLDAAPGLHARVRRRPEERWHRRDGLALGFKYGAFPLALALLFFRAHQVITYGGPLGEYRMFGLGHYLTTLFHFEMTTLGQLAGVALVLRLLAEGVTLALTAAMPRRASGLRRGAEITVRVVYYAVIPALVVARFLF